MAPSFLPSHTSDWHSQDATWPLVQRDTILMLIFVITRVKTPKESIFWGCVNGTWILLASFPLGYKLAKHFGTHGHVKNGWSAWEGANAGHTWLLRESRAPSCCHSKQMNGCILFDKLLVWTPEFLHTPWLSLSVCFMDLLFRQYLDFVHQLLSIFFVRKVTRIIQDEYIIVTPARGL